MANSLTLGQQLLELLFDQRIKREKEAANSLAGFLIK